MKKLLIVIPGFGNPFFNEKVQILNNNIKTLKKSCNNLDITILIFLYSLERLELLNSLIVNDSSISIKIIPKKGIIGQYIYNDLTIPFVKDYDYILFLLDDIEINRMIDFDDIIKIYHTNFIDILGFPLTLDSPTPHKFMKVKDDYVTLNTPLLRVNFIEFFCYFMDINTFYKYKTLFTQETYWLWGLDLVLSNIGFKLFRLETYPIKHHFKSGTYSHKLPDPHIELNVVKSKYPYIKEMKIMSYHCIN